jgi:hypothetical protein
MKKISPFFTFVLVSFLLFSCKKEKKDPNPVPTTSGNSGGTSYKKLKTVRFYNATGTYTSISLSTYGYNSAGVPTTISGADSSFNGMAWYVSTYNGTFSMNSSQRISKVEYFLGGTPIPYVVDYVYDSSGKIIYEIQSNSPTVDTAEYIHNGNKTVKQPKYPGAGYWKEYYTDGDLDSSVYVSTTMPPAKTVYSYSSAFDLSQAYLAKYMALPNAGKELTAETNFNNGSVTGTGTYSYVKDNDGYPVKVNIVTGSPGVTHKSYTYY